MLFTEPGFLFLFLPLLAAVYWFLPLRGKNLLLLSSSLFFYWWGERLFILIVVSMLLNWGLGLLVDKQRFPRAARYWMWSAVIANLGLLGVYKYANFVFAVAEDIVGLAGGGPLGDPWKHGIHLPIGISFFTFQGMSYVLDVYWGLTNKRRDPSEVGLYLAMFPQLIAGPIVRFREIADQLCERGHSFADVVAGLERFTIGLGKKLIIANSIAGCADAVFATPSLQLSAASAWLGIITYAIQLYFDFSGYSDMAIGLGRIFGFRLPENFRHPYVSRSVTELWQRWHITLAHWLRDYLFFPLAGKRPSQRRIKYSLFIVFVACGLWHGAAWTFVLWGCWNGLFLVLERGSWGQILGRSPKLFAWALTMLVWLLGLVLFRSPDLAYAADFALAMAGRSGNQALSWTAFPTVGTWIMLVVGAIGSTPWLPWLIQQYQRQVLLLAGQARAWLYGAQALRCACLILVFTTCVLMAASRTRNPFLYFQF